MAKINNQIPSVRLGPGIKWVDVSLKQYLAYIVGGYDAIRRITK